MKNAKLELMGILEGVNTTIKCAEVLYILRCDAVPEKTLLLKESYSDVDLANFLKELDFEYDSGHGYHYVFGTVWLDDNTWLTRGDYDGSEWWVYNKLPEIPKELNSIVI